MNFQNRKEAAHQLVEQLLPYKGQNNAYVLGLSNGGMQTAYDIAEALQLPLNILLTQHLHFPNNPKATFGAVAETGIVHYTGTGYKEIDTETLSRVIGKAECEIALHRKKFRNNKPLPSLEEKTVILVDDGIATGTKIQSAIQYCSQDHATQIIVAVPIAGSWILSAIKEQVDQLIVLKEVTYYFSTAEAYHTFQPLHDDEVVALIQKWEASHASVD